MKPHVNPDALRPRRMMAATAVVLLLLVFLTATVVPAGRQLTRQFLAPIVSPACLATAVEIPAASFALAHPVDNCWLAPEN